MPPYTIIPSIRTLPPELKIFSDSGPIDVACASSGYMNKDAFLFWTLTFINSLSVYRLMLPATIRNSRAVLILDGHSSRACPIALWLLDKANVEVIIEPANTSHVVQMFDVGLANPFKSCFRQLFHRLEKKDTTEFPSIIEGLRNHAAQAIISSWAAASGIVNRLSAAKVTRIHPFDPDVVLNSRFIFQLNDQQLDRQAKRDACRKAGLDIKSKILTENEMMNIIREKVQEQERYNHLCVVPPDVNSYVDLVKFFKKKEEYGTRFLSKEPLCNASMVPILLETEDDE